MTNYSNRFIVNLFRNDPIMNNTYITDNNLMKFLFVRYFTGSNAKNPGISKEEKKSFGLTLGKI